LLFSISFSRDLLIYIKEFVFTRFSLDMSEILFDPWAVKSVNIWGRVIPSQDSLNEKLRELDFPSDRIKLISYNNLIVSETLYKQFHPSEHLSNCNDANEKKILELNLEQIKLMARQADILGLDYLEQFVQNNAVCAQLNLEQVEIMVRQAKNLGLDHCEQFLQNSAVVQWYLLVMGSEGGGDRQKFRKGLSPKQSDIEDLMKDPKLSKYPEYLLAMNYMLEYRKKAHKIAEINMDMKKIIDEIKKLNRQLGYRYEKRDKSIHLLHCNYCEREKLHFFIQRKKPFHCDSQECIDKHGAIKKKTNREANKQFDSLKKALSNRKKEFEGKLGYCKGCGMRRKIRPPEFFCDECFTTELSN
jgi:hypothetical protein